MRETISGRVAALVVVVQWSRERRCADAGGVLGHPDGLEVYRRVTDVIDGLGEAEVRVSKSQIAFRARRGSRTCGGPVGMSTTTFPRCCRSRYPPRTNPSALVGGASIAKVWMHHLEIRDPDQVDDEVARWLRDAYDAAS